MAEGRGVQMLRGKAVYLTTDRSNEVSEEGSVTITIEESGTAETERDFSCKGLWESLVRGEGRVANVVAKKTWFGSRISIR
jgi:hypothetical protein